MATTRIIITPQTPLGPYPALPVTANALDITFAACDASLKNYFVPSGRDLLLVYNSDATNPYTFTLFSVADAMGRTGDITTYSLSAGETAAVLLTSMNGWVQTDGNVYVDGSNVKIKFAVIRL
jgi:hypothetical protein